jgi:hypothetical protein
VASFQAVQGLVKAFSLREPLGLGVGNVFVGNNPPDAAIFVYDSVVFGRVWVGESLPDIPDDASRAEAYAAMVAQNGQPDERYTSEIISIRVGVTALLRYASDPPSDPTVIEWVEKGVQFQALGPTLTSDQAITISNFV